MIEIRPIKPEEWAAAKRVVYCVAHEIFAGAIRKLKDDLCELERLWL